MIFNDLKGLDLQHLSKTKNVVYLRYHFLKEQFKFYIYSIMRLIWNRNITFNITLPYYKNNFKVFFKIWKLYKSLKNQNYMILFIYHICLKIITKNYKCFF